MHGPSDQLLAGPAFARDQRRPPTPGGSGLVFAVRFLLLMREVHKRSARRLALFAVGVLIGLWLSLEVQVLPSLTPQLSWPVGRAAVGASRRWPRPSACVCARRRLWPEGGSGKRAPGHDGQA